MRQLKSREQGVREFTARRGCRESSDRAQKCMHTYIHHNKLLLQYLDSLRCQSIKLVLLHGKASSLRCQSMMTGIPCIQHSVYYTLLPTKVTENCGCQSNTCTGQHPSTVACLHLLCRFGCHPICHASPQSGAWPRSLSSDVYSLGCQSGE